MSKISIGNCARCGKRLKRRRQQFCNTACRSVPLEERFWSKVDRNGPIPEHLPHLGPCWTWLGAQGTRGYGLFFADRHRRAHQVAFFIEHGRWSRACVLHACDHPGCVRPSHLFEGTQLDNIQDRHAKGRSRGGRVLGSRHGLAKLTEDIVRAMRREYAAGGVSQYELGKRYGVTQAAVGDVVRRRLWKHVD